MSVWRPSQHRCHMYYPKQTSKVLQQNITVEFVMFFPRATVALQWHHSVVKFNQLLYSADAKDLYMGLHTSRLGDLVAAPVSGTVSLQNWRSCDRLLHSSDIWKMSVYLLMEHFPELTNWLFALTLTLECASGLSRGHTRNAIHL